MSVGCDLPPEEPQRPERQPAKHGESAMSKRVIEQLQSIMKELQSERSRLKQCRARGTSKARQRLLKEWEEFSLKCIEDLEAVYMRVGTSWDFDRAVSEQMDLIELMRDSLPRRLASSAILDDFDHAECVQIARQLLAHGKYLSGPDLEFLDSVLACDEFDLRTLRRLEQEHWRELEPFDESPFEHADLFCEEQLRFPFIS
jgi:hypothetical protein